MESNLSLLQRLSTNLLESPTLLLRVENQIILETEEKNWVLERIEGTMRSFHQGQATHFQMTSNVIDKLDKWTGISDKETERAFNSYLSEINSLSSSKVENIISPEITKPISSTIPSKGSIKRSHREIEDLIERMSGANPDEDEDEHRLTKRRAQEEDMPWYHFSSSFSQ